LGVLDVCHRQTMTSGGKYPAADPPRAGKGRRRLAKTRTAVGSARRSALRQAILAYLDAHPGAADSALGIRLWWLPPALGHAAGAEVAGVLAAMVAERLLRARRLPGGQLIFAALRRPLPRRDGPAPS
jgi:hypothetical protein